MQIRIETPIPEKVSSNEIYARMHWSKRKKLVDLYHQSMMEFRGLKVRDYPVDITYIFSFSGKLLDCDNLSSMAKMLKDGMRRWNIIEDDSPKFVQSVTLISRKGKKDMVEIIIT